jgi:hypothetical protein
VIPATWYASNLDALSQLLSGDDPPLHYIRKRMICVALYGFADASSTGFGSTMETQEGAAYSYSIWGRDRDHDSSNLEN